MNSTKKMTQAALLTSLFIVITVFAVGIGAGYAVYLDFIVPVFFAIIYLKCELKYSILSSISSVLIVFLVLGNIGTAIWMSQSIILGMLCGILINKETSIIDDFLYGSIVGVIIMVFLDIYASKLIGYSFMKEFEGYANMFNNYKFTNIVFYVFIALLPMGTIFCVYILTLLLGSKINILNKNSNKKLYMLKNFKVCGRYLSFSKKVFIYSSLYILIFEILNILGFKINQTYINTILISSQYICFYFVIRDAIIIIQNYIILKYNKISYLRIFSLITFLGLVLFFKVTTFILIILNLIIDKKISIRINQNVIIDNYINKLLYG